MLIMCIPVHSSLQTFFMLEQINYKNTTFTIILFSGTFAFVKDCTPGRHALVSRSNDLKFDTPHCLTFKYYRTGGTGLVVKLGSYSPNTDDIVLWKQNRTTTKWLDARVELESITNISRVIIEAISARPNNDCFLAVDSIDIINETCPIRKYRFLINSNILYILEKSSYQQKWNKMSKLI